MVIFALKLLVDGFLNYEMNNVLCFFFFSLLWTIYDCGCESACVGNVN